MHDFGDLHRLTPIGGDFGWSRGQPIDRYYIERFLSAHASDIRGRVLEFQTDTYTRQFGGDRVTARDIVDNQPGNPHATLVADITRPEDFPADVFDCVICTQVLLLVYDVRAAVRALHRVLKPDGVLLLTVPGIGHKIVRDAGAPIDYWRFTALSLRRLFEEVFTPASIEVTTSGNVLSAVAFLHGLAAQEVGAEALDAHDDDYEVSIGLRVMKDRGR